MKIFKKTEMSIDDSEILCENISADREENSDTDEDVNPEVRLNQDLNHQMNLRPRQSDKLWWNKLPNFHKFRAWDEVYMWIYILFQIVYLYEHVYIDYSIEPFNIALIYMLNMITIVLTDLYVT